MTQSPLSMFSSLSNGLRIVTKHVPYAESVAIGIFARAGSRAEETFEHGMAHLLEHMAFKGTPTRSARHIVEEIEQVGGDINAETSVETTAYTARVLKDDAPMALEILSDIVQNATFRDKDLDVERSVIEQEIGAALDTPDDRVQDLLSERAFAGQSIGRTILGTPQSLAGFTTKHLDEHRKKAYQTQSLVVTVSGNINHEEVEDLAATKLSGLNTGKGAVFDKAHYTGGLSFEEADLHEVNLALGLPGCAYGSELIESIHVVSQILGGGMSSRLFQEAREARGLCYAIDAYHWSFSDTGLFVIQCASEPEQIFELCEVIKAELESLSATLQSKEIARAKAQLRAGLLMSDENLASSASRLARQTLAYGQPLSQREQLERIDSVGAEAVRKAIDFMLTQGPVTLAVVGPKASIDTAKAFEDQLNSLMAYSRGSN
jgi:predicted Zn-dependent peptidase